MPEPDWLEAGRKLFAGRCEFVYAAARVDGLPPVGAPEIAFAGRSNVGKSSLVNALTGRSALARTSHTPGRTQELIFFDLNGVATLVDMPGYGYAAVSKEKSASWGKLVRDYLRGRPSLLRVFVLVDGRHGLKDSDRETMKLLDASAVSYAVVLTKRDEVKIADQAARVEATLEALARHVAAYPEVIFTSSRTGDGVAELRAHVARLLAEREGRALLPRNRRPSRRAVFPPPRLGAIPIRNPLPERTAARPWRGRENRAPDDATERVYHLGCASGRIARAPRLAVNSQRPPAGPMVRLARSGTVCPV